MRRPLNDAQRAVLRRIGAGDISDLTNSEKISARSLGNRYLVKVKGSGATWHARLTEDGEYFLRHGTYPPENDGRAPTAGR